MWIILFFLGAFGVKEISSSCSKESIDLALQKCDTQFNLRDNAVEEMCKRADCIIQCKIDAVGECQTREEFRPLLMTYDAEKWKIYYRLTCANPHFQQFVPACDDNMVCTQDELKNIFNPTLTDKNALCSMFANMRRCVSRSPKGKCTADVARFDEDVRKLGYSISICENTDIKYLYEKYGGDVKCGAATNDGSSSTARLSSALYVVNLMLLYCCVNVLQRQFS